MRRTHERLLTSTKMQAESAAAKFQMPSHPIEDGHKTAESGRERFVSFALCVVAS